MSDILEKILTHKAAEVAQAKRQMPWHTLRAHASVAEATRGFAAAIRQNLHAKRPAVIAEIKKASPSKGLIRADFDPIWLAQEYQNGGATCLSVLTDIDFFQGSPTYLRQARAACTLPVLRKDFMIDEYQLWEARVWGADCILLIVSALSDTQLLDLTQAALGLGLDVLVEVHDLPELERALKLPTAVLLGVNNRNLRTFETSLQVSLDLNEFLQKNNIANQFLISESGIDSRADIQLLQKANLYAYLIGERFMRAPSPGQALRDLLA